MIEFLGKNTQNKRSKEKNTEVYYVTGNTLEGYTKKSPNRKKTTPEAIKKIRNEVKGNIKIQQVNYDF